MPDARAVRRRRHELTAAPGAETPEAQPGGGNGGRGERGKRKKSGPKGALSAYIIFSKK